MSDGERAVDNAAVHMYTEVHTQNIVILKDNILSARIRCPMSSDVIQAQSGRKSHTSFKSIPSLSSLVTNQSTHTILNLVGELIQGDPRLCNGLHVLTNLTMDFGSFAVVTQEFIVHVVHNRQVAKLLIRGAVKILV